MLTIVTPAPDPSLLTIAELRAAAGVADQSSDAALILIGQEASLAIARACGVAQAGTSIPTLRAEIVAETVRLHTARQAVVLSRRPVSAVASVTEDGDSLVVADYEVDSASGLLYRLDSDKRVHWDPTKVVVTYTAGFAVVPPDLRRATMKMVTDMWSTAGRDPNLKRVRIEGVSEREFWVAPTTDPLVPAEVMDLLAPYRNHWIG